MTFDSSSVQSDRGRPASTLNYDGRVFRSVANSDGGDVGPETIFHYFQRDEVVWATYEGGSVLFGTLVAKADSAGTLDMRYQHLTADGTFKTGRCRSRPEVLADGRVRVHEEWEWTGGVVGNGVSIVEEDGS